jgi:predicted amidophosphoribosyltransferase
MSADHLAHPHPHRGGRAVDTSRWSLVAPMAGDRPALTTHAVAPYWGWLRDLIKALKYRGDLSQLGFLGHLLYRHLDRHVDRDRIDLILPNPTHPARPVRHTELLVAAVAAADGGNRWPFDDPARPTLVKARPTGRSHGLDRAGRHGVAMALRGALDVRQPSHVAGQRLLVIDDVTATGAQLHAVADVLLRHGAAEVIALVLAATRTRSRP